MGDPSDPFHGRPRWCSHCGEPCDEVTSFAAHCPECGILELVDTETTSPAKTVTTAATPVATKCVAYPLESGRTLVIAESSPRRIVDTRRHDPTEDGGHWYPDTIETLARKYESTAKEIRKACDEISGEITALIKEREAAIAKRIEHGIVARRVR